MSKKATERQQKAKTEKKRKHKRWK